MSKYDQEIEELELHKYTWCLHCEIVHETVKWIENKHECPKCKASLFKDGWGWEDTESGQHGNVFTTVNGYPKTPIEGKEYPLYPK